MTDFFSTWRSRRQFSVQLGYGQVQHHRIQKLAFWLSCISFAMTTLHSQAISGFGANEDWTGGPYYGTRGTFLRTWMAMAKPMPS